MPLPVIIFSLAAVCGISVADNPPQIPTFPDLDQLTEEAIKLLGTSGQVALDCYEKIHEIVENVNRGIAEAFPKLLAAGPEAQEAVKALQTLPRVVLEYDPNDFLFVPKVALALSNVITPFLVVVEPFRNIEGVSNLVEALQVFNDNARLVGCPADIFGCLG